MIRSREKDTFIDIAQAYHLGYDELVEANPGIDPWLPGEGTSIVLPSRFVLPDAPRQGIVLNVAAKRLFYYPKAQKGAPRAGVHLPDQHRARGLGDAARRHEGGLEEEGPAVARAGLDPQGARRGR